MSKYTLKYFPLPARAQVHKLTLAVGGADWTFKVIQKEEWPAIKAEATKSESFQFPWLPCLEVDDTKSGGSKFVASQSIPALRLVARRFGLDGVTDADKVMVDSIIEVYTELFKGYVMVFFSPQPDSVAEEFLKILEKNGGFLENILRRNKSGYLVGKKLTVADLVIYSVLYEAASAVAGKTKHKIDWSKLPVLKTHHEKIAAEPKVKAYYSK